MIEYWPTFLRSVSVPQFGATAHRLGVEEDQRVAVPPSAAYRTAMPVGRSPRPLGARLHPRGPPFTAGSRPLDRPLDRTGFCARSANGAMPLCHKQVTAATALPRGDVTAPKPTTCGTPSPQPLASPQQEPSP